MRLTSGEERVTKCQSDINVNLCGRYLGVVTAGNENVYHSLLNTSSVGKNASCCRLGEPFEFLESCMSYSLTE